MQVLCHQIRARDLLLMSMRRTNHHIDPIYALSQCKFIVTRVHFCEEGIGTAFANRVSGRLIKSFNGEAQWRRSFNEEAEVSYGR
jgi:hypothetical protein